MNIPPPDPEVELASRPQLLRLQGFWRRQTDEDICKQTYGAHVYFFLDGEYSEGAD